MFSEKLAEFNEVKASYEVIITMLLEKRNQLETKMAQAKEVYNQTLINDIEKCSKRTQTELAKLLQVIEEYKHLLSDNEQRIEVAREVMTKRLQALLPGLKEARDMAIQETRDEIKHGENRARELKARYILFARHLNQPFSKAREINSQFLNAAHAVSIHEFDRDRLDLPMLNLVGTYEGPHTSLMPTVNEVTEAYTIGKLPFFVQLYGLTGEILPENEARKKLESLRRESGKNE